MKNITIVMAALATGALLTFAQDADQPRGEGRGPRPGGPGGPGGPGRMPLIAALDANKDGKIDAAEIANASAALKTLDKNGDGELTMDELMPPRGPRPGGPGGPGGRPPEQ